MKATPVDTKTYRTRDDAIDAARKVLDGEGHYVGRVGRYYVHFPELLPYEKVAPFYEKKPSIVGLLTKDGQYLSLSGK